MADSATLPAIVAHGASVLPAVELDSYNAELKDEDSFIGDRANRRAFCRIIENWRKPLREQGDDPFGDEPSEEISKKTFDRMLTKGDAEAAGIVQGAIEDFSQELALVIRRFLRTKAWKDTERIVIGGGFVASRVGEIVVGRTAVILKADDVDIDLVSIRNDPDEAGLIGAVHLAPRWMFKAHDAIVGIDIGGTNIRAGIVELNQKKARDLKKASVADLDLWQHREEGKVSREEAVERLVRMLEKLIAQAKKKSINLAPFIGIGCPGHIDEDGTIKSGAQNLPGNWESSRFHLPALLHEAIPRINDEETAIVMHNDAVVQGLSEAPFMTDVSRWGVLTIGTGLGNARFTNRESD